MASEDSRQDNRLLTSLFSIFLPGREQPCPKFFLVMKSYILEAVLYKRIPKPLQHFAGEALRIINTVAHRWHYLLKEKFAQPGTEPGVLTASLTVSNPKGKAFATSAVWAPLRILTLRNA